MFAWIRFSLKTDASCGRFECLSLNCFFLQSSTISYLALDNVFALLMDSQTSPTQERSTSKGKDGTGTQARSQLSDEEEFGEHGGVQYLTGLRFYLFMTAYALISGKAIMR